MAAIPHHDLFNYRYRIKKKLGEGAQGAVHLATDTVIDREVAIKVLHVGQSDQWQALFRHEFEILADLSHPYLAQVHDFGVTPEGEVFFTRDFIAGKDLIDATDGVGAAQFVAICVQMCRALRPLHRSGLIHGDIKPGNLVFGNSWQNGDGTWHCSAFPIDFSFVRASSGQAPPRGTLQYIAPEILSQAPADVRADLYALGISIFQAASGKLPFEPDIQQILAAHRNGDVPEWRTDRITGTRPEAQHILDGLGHIIQRLLATSPDDRFPDLDELEAALTALCPAAVVQDTESYIPSRNVMTRQDGLSRDSLLKKISDQLQLFYDEKAQDALFVVEGEVGAGRSAVRKAVKWQSQLRGIHVLETSFYSETDWFAPLREMLLQAATVLGGTPDEQKCKNMASQLSGFGSADAPVDVPHLFDAVVGLLKQAASVKPLLITIDNLDRACGELLTVLRTVMAPGQTDGRLAVLATSVTEFDWQDALGPGVAQLIPPLSEAEIAKMVTHYLRVDGESLAAKILEHTGGNPLFVTQLLHNCLVTEKSAELVIEETVVTDVQAYWAMKLSELNDKERELLQAIAVLGHPSPEDVILKVAQLDETDVPLFRHLEQQRWLKGSQNSFGIRSTSLARQILSTLSVEKRRGFSARAFEVEPDMAQRIRHAAILGNADFLNANAMTTVSALEQQGALSVASGLLQEIVDCANPGQIAEDAALAFGRILIALGELARARTQLLALKNSTAGPIRQSALRYLGKISAQESALDDAAELLKKALSIDGTATTLATVYYELCEIEFRRGRYETAIETANRGLDLLDGDSEHRCNLLCGKAKYNAAIGHHDVAMLLVNEAIELAERCGRKQLLAMAVDIRSWVLGLMGQSEDATKELEKAAALYREIGDTFHLARSLQIIGDNYWWQEKWSLMLKNHEEALHVAASLDNPAGRNERLVAYGYALICIGRFEKADLVLQRARAEATRINDAFQLAQIAAYEGEWNALQGNDDEALNRWKAGYQGFEKLSAHAVLAELALLMAGVLITRNQSADLLAAEKWIEKARTSPREDQGRQFEYLLQLTESRLLIAQGAFEEGSRQMNDLLTRLSAHPFHHVKWQAHYYIALAMLDKGMKVVARKQLRQAETSLNALSLGLPPEHRVSFWQENRRADVKRLLEKLSSEQLCDSTQLELQTASAAETEKLYKVLEINKRISRETNITTLTEEILDSAIELTGAERGFFLAKGEDGLTIRAARQLSRDEGDSPHHEFSTSIAESVYLDNEPVLTTDAAMDPRFNEFLSIHHLQIRSVACLPIAWRAEVLGVLYLENRLAKGKFDHQDMRVLSAFSDQMAIALAHAAVLEEKDLMHSNLEQTASDLNALVARQSEDLKSKQAGLALANEQLQRIRNRIASSGNYYGMVGTGDAMQKVFNLIERVRQNDIPVVITGASGTGKDMVAKVIHESGHRSSGPFVTLACGAIPENLVESTLFGYRKGAFSGAQVDSHGIFAAASGGTLYLDDIAEMPMRMQVDLLRVLQEGAFTPLGDHRKFTIDFRLLCSSKVPLQELVDNGVLREDLYYRLQVITIDLPNLRARIEDIPLLAVHIARNEATRLDVPWSGFNASTLNRLAQQPWSGNIREMEQYIRRLLIIGQSDDDGAVGADTGIGSGSEPLLPMTNQTGFSAGPPTADGEKERIVHALESCQWNKTRAAEMLGMPRRTFYRRLKQFDIV